MEPAVEPGSWLVGPATGGHMISVRLRQTHVVHVALASSSSCLQVASGRRLPRRLRDFMPFVQNLILELVRDPCFLDLPAAALTDAVLKELLWLRPYVLVLVEGLRFRLFRPGGESCSIDVDLRRCCFWITPITTPLDIARGSALRRHQVRLFDVLQLCPNRPQADGGQLQSHNMCVDTSRYMGFTDWSCESCDGASMVDSGLASPVATPSAVREQLTLRSARMTRIASGMLNKRRSNKILPHAVAACATPAMVAGSPSSSRKSTGAAPRVAPVSARTSPFTSYSHVERVGSLTSILVLGRPVAGTPVEGLTSRRASTSVVGAEKSSSAAYHGTVHRLGHAKYVRALRHQLWHLWLDIRAAPPDERARWRDAGLIVALLEVVALAPSAIAVAAPSSLKGKMPREGTSLQALEDGIVSKHYMREASTTRPTLLVAAGTEDVEGGEALESDVGAWPDHHEASCAFHCIHDCSSSHASYWQCAWMRRRDMARNAAMAAVDIAVRRSSLGSKTHVNPGIRASVAAAAAAKSIHISEVQAESASDGFCACCAVCTQDAHTARGQPVLHNECASAPGPANNEDAQSLASARGTASFSDLWWLPESLILDVIMGDEFGIGALARACAQLLRAGTTSLQLLWAILQWSSLPRFREALAASKGFDFLIEIATSPSEAHVALKEFSSDTGSPMCLWSVRRLVATQILAAMAHESTGIPALAQALPAFLDLLLAAQMQWPRNARGSPCWRRAVFAVIMATRRWLPQPVRMVDNFVVNHEGHGLYGDGIVDHPGAQTSLVYARATSTLSLAARDAFRDATREPDGSSAFLRHLAARILSGGLRASSSPIDPISCGTISAVRLLADYLLRDGELDSNVHIHKLVVAPLSTLCQRLFGSVAVAAASPMQTNSACESMQLTSATLHLAHALFSIGQSSEELYGRWLSLFTREPAMRFVHEAAGVSFSMTPNFFDEACTHFGSEEAVARLIRDSRAVISQHLCDLAHASSAASSLPRPALAVAQLWGPAKRYLLSFFVAKANGKTDLAYRAPKERAEHLGDGNAFPRLDTSCGRGEAKLLQFVALAMAALTTKAPTLDMTNTPTLPSDWSNKSMSDLAEALWQCGVHHYSASEAALRSRLAPRHSDGAPLGVESGGDTSPDMGVGAPARDSSFHSGEGDLQCCHLEEASLSVGIVMRAEVAARFFDALGAITLLRIPEVMARLSALGVARALIIEISLEQQLPRAQLSSTRPPYTVDEPVNVDSTLSSERRATGSSVSAERAVNICSDGEDSEVSSNSDIDSHSPSRHSCPPLGVVIPRLSGLSASGPPLARTAVPALFTEKCALTPKRPLSGHGTALARSPVPKLQISGIATHRTTASSDASSTGCSLQASSSIDVLEPGGTLDKAHPASAKGRPVTHNAAVGNSQQGAPPLPASTTPLARVGAAYANQEFALKPLSPFLASGRVDAVAPIIYASSDGSVSSLLGQELTLPQYTAERTRRILYACSCVHRSVLLLLTYLFVAPNGLSLDAGLAEASRYQGVIERAGETEISQSGHLVFDAHINHPMNAPLLPDLISIASKNGEAYGVLLRLISSPVPGRATYKVGSIIARGAFGAVCAYEPRDGEHRTSLDVPLSRDRPLVVKLLPKATSRFARSTLPEIFVEVLSLQRLQHTGVAVELIGYGSDSSGIYLVMPRYAYTLRSWRRGLAVDQFAATNPKACDVYAMLEPILALYAQATRAVRQLRSLRIEHFDIKADNFLLDPNGESHPAVRNEAIAANDIKAAQGHRLVIADLGVARIYDANEEGCSPRDRGTEFIKSPEMLEVIQRSGLRTARGKAQAIDPEPGMLSLAANVDREWAVPGACDVWACGCLLYEILTGDYLFEEPDWFRFYLRVTALDSALLTSSNRSKLPAVHEGDIANFICRVLERDPRKRMHITELEKDFASLRERLLRPLRDAV